MRSAFAEQYTDDFYPSRTDTKSGFLERLDPVIYQCEPAGDYSLSPEQLEQYERDGYLILKDYFSQETVGQLRRELDRLCNDESIRELEGVITEPDSKEIRSLFNLPDMSCIFDNISRSHKILDNVMQILGGPVYLHQSRINIKPAFKGRSFPWHSDFETWHVEDGLPRMRALSCSVFLTQNNSFNGPLFAIPGSHKYYLSCTGETPEQHFRRSLKKQVYGSPDNSLIKELLKDTTIKGCFGNPGDMLIFDSNVLHGSPDNISNLPRTNLFLAYNSCKNVPQKPYCGLDQRPVFLANRDYSPLAPIAWNNS